MGGGGGQGTTRILANCSGELEEPNHHHRPAGRPSVSVIASYRSGYRDGVKSNLVHGNSINQLEARGGCVSISIPRRFRNFRARRAVTGSERAKETGRAERERERKVLSVVHRTQDRKRRIPFANSTANYVPTSRGSTLAGCIPRSACHSPSPPSPSGWFAADSSFRLFQSFL